MKCGTGGRGDRQHQPVQRGLEKSMDRESIKYTDGRKLAEMFAIMPLIQEMWMLEKAVNHRKSCRLSQLDSMDEKVSPSREIFLPLKEIIPHMSKTIDYRMV